MTNPSRINQDAKLGFLKRRSGAFADGMREELDSLEADAVRLELRSASEILQLLARMDALKTSIRTLQKEGATNLHSEETRFQGVVDKIVGKRNELLQKIKEDETLSLSQARPEEATLDENVWWFLDELVAQDRAAFRRKVAWIGGGLMSVLLIIIILFNTVLKPDPETIARFELFEDALGVISVQQDYSAALTMIDEALTLRPEDMELLLFKAVILREMGEDPAEIDQLLTQAETLALQPVDVPVFQGRIYLRTGVATRTIEFSEKAIAVDPESPEAWLTLGQGHAMLGQEEEAISALDQASQLAFDQGRDELYVTAKLNMTYISGDSGLADDSDTFLDPPTAESP